MKREEEIQKLIDEEMGVDNYGSSDYQVGVHDGVRPFVSAEVIARCYAEAARIGAVVPVTDVVETVRHLKDGGKSETVSRDDYKLVQTPQVFSLSLLKRAYAQPYVPAFTDDASVVEKHGKSLSYTIGERLNIKITTQEDLLLSRAVDLLNKD